MEDNPYIEAFAERLAFLRGQKDVSAREMSLSLGMTHTFIRGLENKRCFPAMLNFFNICDYLGITPKDFFDYTQDNPSLDDEILSEIQKLDPKSKEYYLNMIRETNNRPK